MSDTTQRTVAEIIGYVGPHESHNRDRFCDWCDSPLPLPYPCPDNPTPPTFDDMLAWLRERGYNVSIKTDHDASEVEVSVAEDGCVMVPFYESTLHAALEAAVRAVAEAE